MKLIEKKVEKITDAKTLCAFCHKKKPNFEFPVSVKWCYSCLDKYNVNYKE